MYQALKTPLDGVDAMGILRQRRSGQPGARPTPCRNAVSGAALEVIGFAGGQLTVRTCPRLVPPLEQPRSPVLPPGVCTTTLKLPGAGIMEDVMVTVSSEVLITVVARGAPLKTTTEEETKWLP